MTLTETVTSDIMTAIPTQPITETIESETVETVEEPVESETVMKTLTDTEKTVLELFECGQLIDLSTNELSVKLIKYYKDMPEGQKAIELESINETLKDITQKIVLAKCNLGEPLNASQMGICKNRFPELEFLEIQDSEGVTKGYKCQNGILQKYSLDFRTFSGYVPLTLSMSQKMGLDTKNTRRISDLFRQWEHAKTLSEAERKKQKINLDTIEKHLNECIQLSTNGRSLKTSLVNLAQFELKAEIAILKERISKQGARKQAYTLKRSCIKISNMDKNVKATDTELNNYLKVCNMSRSQVKKLFESGKYEMSLQDSE